MVSNSSRFMRTSEPTSLMVIEKYLAPNDSRIGRIRQEDVKPSREGIDIIEAEPDRFVKSPHWCVPLSDYERGRSEIVAKSCFLTHHGVGTPSRRIFKTMARCRPGHDREPIPAGTRHPRHRVQDSRCNRHEARHRETAMIRVRAGFLMRYEAMDEGHCGLPADVLVPSTIELLGVQKNWSRPPWTSSLPSEPYRDTVARRRASS